MSIFIGLIVVFFIILYKRSTEIIVVNPMRHSSPAAPVPRGPEDDEPDAPAQGLDFGRLLNTIQQAAAEAANEASQPRSAGAKLPSSPDKGRAAILALVRNHQFIEAMQLYRRAYGVDLQTAKKAIDKMRLEQ